jgi:hypothetical protein
MNKVKVIKFCVISPTKKVNNRLAPIEKKFYRVVFNDYALLYWIFLPDSYIVIC